MNKLLWSIPGATIYLYALSILTQYGFVSYFNLPATFVSASPIENTVFAYSFFKLGLGILGLIRWWLWVFLVIVIIAGSIFFSSRSMKSLMVSSITILAILFLYNAVSFGDVIAKNQTRFLALSSDCLAIEKAATMSYIIPATYDAKAALVSIDPVTKKMAGSFLVKDFSELPCRLEFREIGQVIR